VLDGSAGTAPIDVGARPSSVVGRIDSADIVLEHSSISRHHAALAHHKEGHIYVIECADAVSTRHPHLR
jgi:hypothetical protein